MAVRDLLQGRSIAGELGAGLWQPMKWAGKVGRSAIWNWFRGSLDGQIRYYLVTIMLQINSAGRPLNDLIYGVARNMPERA
jgi:hypothetical protein